MTAGIVLQYVRKSRQDANLGLSRIGARESLHVGLLGQTRPASDSAIRFWPHQQGSAQALPSAGAAPEGPLPRVSFPPPKAFAKTLAFRRRPLAHLAVLLMAVQGFCGRYAGVSERCVFAQSYGSGGWHLGKGPSLTILGVSPF